MKKAGFPRPFRFASDEVSRCLLQNETHRDCRLAGQGDAGDGLSAGRRLVRRAFAALEALAGGFQVEFLFLGADQEGQAGAAAGDVERLAVVAQVELDGAFPFRADDEFVVDVLDLADDAAVQRGVRMGVVVGVGRVERRGGGEEQGGEQGEGFHGFSLAGFMGS